jgi:hypothetical protein
MKTDWYPPILLSNSLKIVIGAATLWQSIYPLLFFAVWLIFPLSMMAGERFEGMTRFPLAGFMAIFPLHCVTIVIMMGLGVFYLVHIIKNNAANDVIRIILGIGCFYMPFVAMPIYYYLFIWSDPPPESVLKQIPEESKT